MFGFGRRAGISQQAKALGDIAHHLVSCVSSLSFDEFVEATLRKDFTQSHIDRGFGSIHGNNTFAFVESSGKARDFLFCAHYHRASRPTLIIEGHKQYFGLIITGIRIDEGIYVDLKDIVPAAQRGRDAERLQVELLRFPGFESMSNLLTSLGNRRN